MYYTVILWNIYMNIILYAGTEWKYKILMYTHISLLDNLHYQKTKRKKHISITSPGGGSR